MEKFDVAICGYGPVGATLSLLLAKYNYKVLIIEKNQGPCKTARAINTDGEQLRIFDQFNLAEKVIANSNQIEKVHFSNKDLEPIQTIIASIEDTEMGWPNQVLFYQPELESFLREKIQSSKNIEVKESTELVDFKNTSDGVDVVINEKNQSTKLKSKLLFGCDGASSFIRKKLDINLEDLGYNQKWLVCDAHLTKDIGLKNELVQVCNPSRPGTFLHGRRGHLRFEFRVMPDDDEETIKSESFIWELLSPWINKDNALLERAAIYTFHACIAERWNEDNIFIAGDAAHQMPPFMGAGMGTGIRDVSNLAWKVDLFFNNKCSKEIFKTYQNERYLHAKWTVAQTKSIGEMIEGFCAAEEGKEYTPEGPSYEAKFPHIPEGVYGDTSDMITGCPIPQPILNRERKSIKLDRIIASKFSIISNKALPKLSPKAELIFKHLSFHFEKITSNDDKENRLKNIFDKYDFVVVRPDLYVYGGCELENISNVIESLEDTFFLKL